MICVGAIFEVVIDTGTVRFTPTPGLVFISPYLTCRLVVVHDTTVAVPLNVVGLPLEIKTNVP